MDTALISSDASQGTVLVTGASTGIGRACALSLDALGFRVFAGVRKSGDGESLRRAGADRLTPLFSSHFTEPIAKPLPVHEGAFIKNTCYTAL